MRTAYFVNSDGDAVGVRIMKDGRILYKRAPGAGDHFPRFRPIDFDREEFLALLRQELSRNVRQIKSLLKRVPKE